MDQLKRMAVFAEVVAAGSLTGAARRLGMTPSAVSQHLRQLEGALGLALLHRSTRKLTLTEAGARYIEGCTAMVAAARGYRLVLTMPESMSEERRSLLRAYGAELVLTPAEKGMKGAIAMAKKLLSETPGAFGPGQFDNPANPQVHRETTAEEIWRDTEGNIDAFVSGVGTGGTTPGVVPSISRRMRGLRGSMLLASGSRLPSKLKPGVLGWDWRLHSTSASSRLPLASCSDSVRCSALPYTSRDCSPRLRCSVNCTSLGSEHLQLPRAGSAVWVQTT